MKPFKKRQWLNPVSSEDTGFIIWGKEEDVGEYYLRIGDCHRVITLDISASLFASKAEKKKQMKQRIKKVQILLTALTELEALMTNELGEM